MVPHMVSEQGYFICIHHTFNLPNLKPFSLDYHQALLSLLDIMSEIYHKIYKILGPSPHPHQHMMGPLGLLSPHPGVSYLFQGGEMLGQRDGDGSLWGIVNGSLGGSQIGNGPGGLASPPPTWTPALGVMIEKVDGKFKVSIIPTLSRIIYKCVIPENDLKSLKGA